MTTPATRRTYLDVLRGVAVLVMIEAHVIDSWTREADRHTMAFGQSLILGGFGAPLFLFLAGVGVAMSAGSKSRRFGDDPAAAAAVARRGLQIFGLAFLFRFQSFVLSNAPSWTMLKVDILNIMGPAMIAAVGVWVIVRGVRARIAAFAIATIAVLLITPPIRSFTPLASLPDSLEGYLRPIPGLTNFSFFPWAAFVMAGAIVGVVLDAARGREADRRANVAFLLGGALLALVGYQASYLPPLDPRSRFWTTSLSFFCIRAGLMVAALGAAWLWELRPTAGRRFSPLQLLGTSSLFVYWIHVELVYGLVSRPIHGAFSLAGAWVALAVFCLLMVGAAALKASLVAKFRRGRDLRDKLSRPVLPLIS
jgi:uncharacterized membrane protein